MSKVGKVKGKPNSSLAYRDTLDTQEKARYEGKLKLINGDDPYEIPPSSWTCSESELPAVTYPDIVNYLIFSPSPYTADDLKSYKGLDAYNQFVCGWVRDKTTKIIDDKCLVKAKVLHSQRMSEKALQPWIVAEKHGKILAAHCTCMAGLGETCTHVAALLFAIEATVKLRDSKTVTEEKAYWLLPNSVRGVTYKEVRDIDFTSAKTLKKKLDKKIQNVEENVGTTTRITNSDEQCSNTAKKMDVPCPTAEELSNFFERLNSTDSKPGILSLVPPFSDKFIPKPVNKNFPTVLTELRDDTAMHLNFAELLEKCKSVKVDVTDDQAKAVETVTREQANSKLWYRFRAGRITASKMKTVCHTDPNLPAQSLIKSICYPDSYKFQSKATHWGCEHEQYARDIFVDRLKPHHENIKLEDAGFFINSDVPFIGASPDGIINCDCCGKSTLEIKCPFCKRDSILEDINDPKFYLKKGKDGLRLDHCHQYYYQVQTQLGVCKLETGYFVVWTEKDLNFELINFDAEMWQDMCKKSEHIFLTALLPELVGKFYSRLPFSKTYTADQNNLQNTEDETASDGEKNLVFL